MTNTVNNASEIAGKAILQPILDAFRQIVAEMLQEQQQRTEKALAEQRERPTLTRAQARRELNVSLSTLWHWEKSGYLIPVKVGRKVLYRASDIERMLNRKQKES